MKRRTLLIAGAAGLAGLGATFWYGWPRRPFANPCRAVLPPDLAQHELVLAAWAGVRPEAVWDVHVHLVGVGDSGSGIWLNPRLLSIRHPLQYAQRLFFLNAGCVHEAEGRVDAAYVERMHNLVDGLRPGAKLMLLAFDRNHRDDGSVDWEHTAFYTPNAYAQATAAAHPRYFEWIASIHPYRHDALAALDWAAAHGARAVKWLPNAMGIDPASPRCDAFYEALVRHDLPLLTHAGLERAVWGSALQSLGNPLRLRRALDHGVRVIVAHCASLGEDIDLDRGPNGPRVESFALFERLMGEARYAGRLFGDLSALTQFDRAPYLKRILERREWHDRLLNGTDYPLPGMLPIYHASTFVRLGLLRATAAAVLDRIQQHNPLLFDFVLKRSLRLGKNALPAQVFETRRWFEGRSGGEPLSRTVDVSTLTPGGKQALANPAPVAAGTPMDLAPHFPMA